MHQKAQSTTVESFGNIFHYRDLAVLNLIVHDIPKVTGNHHNLLYRNFTFGILLNFISQGISFGHLDLTDIPLYMKAPVQFNNQFLGWG
jgi:hypothetical protein